MPITPIHLGKLATFMAQVTSPDNAFEVSDIIKQTGISDQTVRRLLKANPDLFIQKPNTYPYQYFYLGSDRGSRIIDRFLTGQQFFNERDDTARTNRVISPPVAAVVSGGNGLNLDPEIEAKRQVIRDRGLDWVQGFVGRTWSSDHKLSESTNVKELADVITMLETTIELIKKRIQVLTGG